MSQESLRQKKTATSNEKPTSSSVEHLLDTPAVADIYGISKRSVPRLVEAGVIPKPIKIGRSVRWLPADIRASFAALS